MWTLRHNLYIWHVAEAGAASTGGAVVDFFPPATQGVSSLSESNRVVLEASLSHKEQVDHGASSMGAACEVSWRTSGSKHAQPQTLVILG